MQEYELKFDRSEMLVIHDCIMEVFKRGIVCICHDEEDESHVYSKWVTLTMLEGKITNALDES